MIFGIPDYQEEFMYYATVHERPIVGGLINRFDKNYLNFLSKNRLLAHLALTIFESEKMERILPIEERNVSGTEDGSLEKLLRKHGIQYVVLHHNFYERFFNQKTNLNRVHEGAKLTVYALPEGRNFTERSDSHPE